MALLFVNCSHKNISISKNRENIKILEKEILQKESSRTLAHTHLKLANLYLKEQMVQLAISTFKKAKTYGEESLKSQVFEAKTLEGIADAYDLLKENTTALAYHQEAYGLIKDKSYQAEEQANILSDIAKEYIELGQTKKAIEPLESALNIMESIHDRLYPKTIRLNNLLESIQEGKGHFKTSLKNQRLLYGRDSLEVADLYCDIAIQKEQQEANEEALEYYDKAIKIYNRKLSDIDEKSYTTYHKRATIQKRLNHYQASFNSAIHAFDGFFKNQTLIFSTLTTQEKKTYIQKHKKYIISLFQNYDNQHKKKLFNRWLNYKRKLYDEENALARLSLSTKNKSAIIQLKKYKYQLAQNYQKHTIDKGVILNLQEKIDKLERHLNIEIFYKNRQNSDINYKQISNLLEKQELYIDFAKIDKNYYIFTLNHNQEITVEKISLKESQKIELIIHDFQQDIMKSSPLKENGFHYLMGAIYKIIFKNIALDKINSLIISPDSSLNLIPFETLYNEENRSYLIEHLAISYIPSGRELITQQHALPPNRDIALFSKSDFSNYTTLEDLTYTTIELQKIKNIYPSATVFQENKATRKNLFNLSKPKFLHLTTHGSYEEKKETLNPLLNCFIYLDKPISGLELSTLNLHGTELVVLSACQTGVGKIENSEGVSSMAKALMEGGAKNILVALWLINDKATSKLMELFYQNIKKGLSYKESLRQAKLTLLHNPKFEEPYLWSGIILIGKNRL